MCACNHQTCLPESVCLPQQFFYTNAHSFPDKIPCMHSYSSVVLACNAWGIRDLARSPPRRIPLSRWALRVSKFPAHFSFVSPSPYLHLYPFISGRSPCSVRRSAMEEEPRRYRQFGVALRATSSKSESTPCSSHGYSGATRRRAVA